MSAKPTAKPPPKGKFIRQQTSSSLEELDKDDRLTDRRFSKDNSNEPSRKSSSASNCSCTNISIMQLFHEMKQKFPTVPDNIVNECVSDNCHDRENCIDVLQKEFALHPNAAQTYPSQVLRNNNSCNNSSNKLLKPTRPAPSPKICDSSPSDMKPKISDSPPKEQHKRPTTLNLQNSQSQPTSFPLQHSPQSVNLTIKPTRRAPPLPKQRQSSLEQSQSQSSSTTSLLSVSSYSDTTDLSINPPSSLHSPSSSERSGIGTQKERKVSHLQVTPEPPYTKFLDQSPSANQKSFTSVNLSLRPPSLTPQPPIDIQAGPGLSYSTVSYDSKKGLKKHFQISVNDKCGIFSVSQIHPKNISSFNQLINGSYEDQQQLQQLPTTNPYTNNSYSGKTLCDLSVLRGRGPPLKENNEQLQIVYENIIQRQFRQRDKLAKAVMEEEQKLLQVQDEIDFLQMPMDPCESERLDNEIKKLRCDVQSISESLDVNRSDTIENIEENINYSNSFPRQNCHMSQQQQNPYLPPPYSEYNQHHQQLQQQQQQQFNRIPMSTLASDSDSYSTDDDGPPWICRMCTFQNHALLQKCESCENVRVFPGTIRIIPTNPQTNQIAATNESGAANSTASVANAASSNSRNPFNFPNNLTPTNQSETHATA